jgi:hypothetical protein
VKRPKALNIEAMRKGVFYGDVDDLTNGLCDYAVALEAENKRLRGWPEIDIPTAGSPIDTYRCENQDCPSAYEIWQFRPDDYDLDETAVNCPACGVEGEMFFRQFRSGYVGLGGVVEP